MTEEKVAKLIDVAEHPRDKAFICMLYELGARISELGNLEIKGVSKDKYTYLIDVGGARLVSGLVGLLFRTLT